MASRWAAMSAAELGRSCAGAAGDTPTISMSANARGGNDVRRCLNIFFVLLNLVLLPGGALSKPLRCHRATADGVTKSDSRLWLGGGGACLKAVKAPPHLRLFAFRTLS